MTCETYEIRKRGGIDSLTIDEQLLIEDPRRQAEKLGFSIVYVPHTQIKNYNACYFVEYKGKKIYPPAAERLNIPTNEIWISDKWRRFEKYILYHELREIEYREKGYSVEDAHVLSARDGIYIFENEKEWRELIVEITISDTFTMAEKVKTDK